MADRPHPLRIAVPAVEAARALATAWLDGPAPVEAVEFIPLEDAERSLRAGTVDLAFVPTLAVLRDPDAFSVVPGIGLVGKAYASARLHLPAGLASIVPGGTPRVGLDPRLAQEAVLLQVVLKEGYGAHPQFVPVAEGEAAGPEVDAYLLPGDAPFPGGGATTDLGREWFELTTRPMVWALLAAAHGGVDADEARSLRAAARELDRDEIPSPAEEPAAVTLAEYAFAGIEALVHHLYYHRVIEELVEVPFLDFLEDGDSDDAWGRRI